MRLAGTSRRILIGLAVLVLLVAAVWWRAVWVVHRLLHTDAPQAIAEKSGGVYQLTVGRVGFNALRRRIAVDEIQLTTDEARNARRTTPRTTLRLELRDCTVTGLHLFSLIFAQGAVAESFGCAGVRAAAQVPPPTAAGPAQPDTVPSVTPATAQQAFYILQQGLKLPTFAPRVRVDRVDFPHTALALRLPWARGQAAQLELDHLEWHMTDFVVDPADSVATSRPLLSRTVEITATSFLAHPDTGSVVSVAGFHTMLPDSAAEIRGIAYRRSSLTIELGRVALRGLDVGAMLLGAGVHAGRVQVDSLYVDVLSDRRRPRNPVRPVRRTPQAWIADLDRNVRIDSVIVTTGAVMYREHRARRAKPGALTFARLSAVAVNVQHVVGRRSARNPMTLRASAYLQNDARLDARFEVPLDAPSFAMQFSGSLGPMPVTRLNAFVDETFAVRLAKGRIVGIGFDARVASGVAQGIVTPRYSDLELEVTGRGSTGLIGMGGVIGDAARGIATFVGNRTEIRSDNPEDGAAEPRRGVIAHTFAPHETLPGFLWAGIRDGLFTVVRK